MLQVGDILRTQREKKGYSLVTVEKQIRIREKFLRAIEANNWDYFSSKIYIIGILKNYARFLELDDKKILAFFRREYERKEEVGFKERVSKKYLTSDTKRLAVGGIVLIGAMFGIYFLYQLFLYFSPPKILIIEPTQTVFKRVDKIRVVGETEKESSITIFGEKVFQNKEGFFEYDLPLKVGSNTLTIEVVGPNGKKTQVSRQFFRKQ